uniref:Acetyltransferase (GNAT) domain/Acetyltransferase (GNAT) family, putative n=1 Tax=Theileria annulata TaxID=5874 RepID=A0A3B0N0A5_THEAN
MNRIRSFVDVKKGRIPTIKPVSRNKSGRRQKCPSIMIREIQQEDNVPVCKLLFEHFRSLTLPAIIYWLVQHVYDLIAIVVINACLLSIYNLCYFCLLFLVYLFVRARYEIEKHIKESCPDLVDVYKSYRSHTASNFWVAYVSGDQQGESSDEKSDKTPEESKADPDKPESNSKSPPPEKHEKFNHVDEVNELNFSQKCKANEILGCVGITPYRNNPNVAQMVRLVVTRKRRNMRVGSRLLEYLEEKALKMGYNEIRVFTNNLNTAYLQFLKQHNFQIIQVVRRGLMRGDLIIWTKVLNQADQPKQGKKVYILESDFLVYIYLSSLKFPP